METFTAITIFVSVLGVFLILAIVWLVYKFNAKRKLDAAIVAAEPPMRKLIIHRGRVVPASKLTTPSIRSGWTSLKHRSGLLSSPAMRRTDESIASMSRSGTISRHTQKDLESGIFHTQTSYPDMHTVTESHTSLPLHNTTYPYPQSDASQSKNSLVKSPTSQFWNKQYPKSGSIGEKTFAARSFLQDPSSNCLPNFPRPPYLSPLQSRYHVRRAYQPQSPLHEAIDVESLSGKETKI